MRFCFLLVISVLVLHSCSTTEAVQPNQQEAFTTELAALQEFYSIPGLSAVIMKDDQVIYEEYFGYANIDKQIKVDSATAYPIASITKLFTATAIMKLVEEGKLSLSDPVNQYLEESELIDSIQITHLLSHTSQGKIGQEFYYSSRFGLLTKVIERASGKSFKEVIEDKILMPLGLHSSFLLKDSAQITEKQMIIASPYVLDGEIEEGFIDFGYSASAGMVSTPMDLLTFSRALDAHSLISKEATETMFLGLKDHLPYSYGVFNQKIQELDVIWVYGQYDSYSSLLVKIPSEELNLVLLANNNLMSDPARLIMGDITASLFAISFLKNYVFDLVDMPLLEHPDSVYSNKFPEEFYRQKILAQALGESFLARFEPEKMKTSAALIEQTIKKYPDYLSYANINLLHNLSFLKDVAFYKDLGEFKEFDEQIVEIGEHILKQSPNNPYVHIYLGTYFDRSGDQEQAIFHFQSIVELENFSPNWYTREAHNWLNKTNSITENKKPPSRLSRKRTQLNNRNGSF